MRDPSEDVLVEAAGKTASKDDFASFVKALLVDFRQHPEAWENDTLELFLDGLAGFAQDSDGYYAGLGTAAPAHPTWRSFAEFLLAARVYE